MGRKIELKNSQQIRYLKESGKYLNELLIKLYKNSKEGINLLELENISEKYLNKNNLKGSFKGYYGYPANLCLSVNDCIVHGIPYDYTLKKGDLLKIDLGVTYKGMITDSAVSLVIGGDENNFTGGELIKTTKKGLDNAMKHIIPGNNSYGYSNEIYNYITKNGFKVLKNLTGHGVGFKVHEGPFIYNWPHPESKFIKFVPNLVLALEPITCISSTDFYNKKGNSRNLYTVGGDHSAQREYTIVITKNGYEILSGITNNDL